MGRGVQNNSCVNGFGSGSTTSISRARVSSFKRLWCLLSLSILPRVGRLIVGTKNSKTV